MLRVRIRRPDEGECQTLTEGRTVESFQKTKNKKKKKKKKKFNQIQSVQK